MRFTKKRFDEKNAGEFATGDMLLNNDIFTHIASFVYCPPIRSPAVCGLQHPGTAEKNQAQSGEGEAATGEEKKREAVKQCEI